MPRRIVLASLGLLVAVTAAASEPRIEPAAARTATAATPVRPLAPATLRAIDEASRRRVAEWTTELSGLSDGPERRAVQRRIIDEKTRREAELQRARLGREAERASAGGSPALLASWGSCINVCTAASTQTAPAACTDGAGGIIVAWSDARNGGSDIYAQRIDGVGNPVWPTNGVVVCNATGVQGDPVIVADGFGGAIIAWSDPRGTNTDIYALRLLSTGAAATGWPVNGVRLSTVIANEHDPVIAPDGSGGAYVGWTLDYAVDDLDLLCTRVQGNGTLAAGWPANGSTVCAAVGIQTGLQVVPNGISGVYLVWQDSRTGAVGGTDIYGVALSSGSAVLAGWTAGGSVICAASDAQFAPAATVDAQGGLIVAWQDLRGVDWDLYAQRMASNGVGMWTANGVPVSRLAGNPQRPVIVRDGTNGALVAWLHSEPSPSTDAHVYVQHLGGAGQIWPGFPQDGKPVCLSGGFKNTIRAISDDDHGVLIAWNDFRSGTYQVYTQHVSSTGQLAYQSNGVSTPCTNTFVQYWLTVVPDGGHGALVSWADAHPGSDQNIFATRFVGASNVSAFDAPVPWTTPIVPRNDLGFGGTVTPTLDGNLATTHVDYQQHFEGPFPMPAVISQLWLDDEAFLGWTTGTDGLAPGYYATSFFDITVRGGRHQLETVIDPDNQVLESDENDNDLPLQFVWSPLALTRATPLARARPPAPGMMFPEPNADGFSFTRGSVESWVVGAAPKSSGDDVDLIVYSDYVGSTSGFGARAGTSILGSTSTDFVVGHYDETPLTVYPAVVRFNAAGEGTYVIDPNDSFGRTSATTTGLYMWEHQLMDVDHLVDVYEARVARGQTYSFRLRRENGPVHLQFAVFPPTIGGVFNLDGAVAVSGPVDAELDTAFYTPSENGYCPIVVYRPDGLSLGSAVTYGFGWYSGLADAGSPGLPAELALSGPWPNPVRDRTRFELALPHAGRVEMALYDVAGRRLRQVADGEMPAGRHTLEWDGRDDRGLRAAPGLYWLRVHAGGRAFTRRVAVMP